MQSQPLHTVNELVGALVQTTYLVHYAAIAIENAQTFDCLIRRRLNASELDVPALYGDEIIDVLNFESTKERAFSRDDELFLTTLTKQAVLGVKTERYKKAERDAQRFELLYRAGQALGQINEASQLEQAYDVIFRIAEIYNHGQVIIRSYDEATQELVLLCASQQLDAPPAPRIKVDDARFEQITHKYPVTLLVDSSHPCSDIVVATPAVLIAPMYMIVPIQFGSQYYGTLELWEQESCNFQSADLHFFEALVQQLANTLYRLEAMQERREFEQRALAAEAMSAIGQSAFELTHGLGNDLGLVPSYASDILAELDTQGITNALVRRKLDNIIRAVRGVLDRSRQLKRDLASLRANEEKAGEPDIVSPNILFAEAQANVPMPANIDISVEIDCDAASVCVIRSRVTDILRNLIANAIEAMPDGGRLTLRARNAGRSVALEVADTGVGIPQHMQTKIFDLFYSTKSSSGFGLWSARRNAQRNQGELTVESATGQGTTFTLLLPAQKEQRVPHDKTRAHSDCG